jgi:hypothetical protein
MRHIDPATLHDEWYIAQTPQVRLFWLSLLLAVDDQGRFAANPALVRSRLFPADDISLAEVEALLQAVDGKVRFYEINGTRYGQLVNWWKYQGHAIWMGPSRYPAPEGWSDRYRYHAKGNKIVQSSNWRDTPEPGPDEIVEGEPQEAASAAPLESQLGSQLGSAPGSNGGRSDGDVNGDGDGEDDVESEGDGDTDRDHARARPRAGTPPLARSPSGDQDHGTPAPPGNARAQAILLQASGLAALPPSERARVDQVRAMITAYGEQRTVAELRAERERWCRTRGRNGSFYSVLNMGWVDWADEALSGAGPPPEREEFRLPPPLPYSDPVPRPPDVPLPKFLQQKRDAERERAAAPLSDQSDGATGPQEGSVTE